jgi:hypothetical protein
MWGCEWHALTDAVIAVGERSIEHPGRSEAVTALWHNGTLFTRIGKLRVPRDPDRGGPA